MGQHLVTHDPCDPSDFRDPFDPSTHSLLCSAEWDECLCLAVTGGGSVGECGRLSQFSWHLDAYSYTYLTNRDTHMLIGRRL